MIAALQTPRMMLTPFVAGDAGDLFAIRGDHAAMAHWDWPGDDDVVATRLVADIMADEIRHGTAAYWTARDHDGGFVGVFDLSEITPQSADIGFMVVRRQWGNGLGREGAEAMVAEAHRRGIVRLTARFHDGNIRSARLLSSLGFAAAGAVRDVMVRPGVTRRCHHVELELQGARQC